MRSQGLIVLVQNTLHNSWKRQNTTFPEQPHLSQLQPPPQDNLSTLASAPTQRDSQAPFDSPHPRSGLLSSFSSWALEVVAKSAAQPKPAGWLAPAGPRCLLLCLSVTAVSRFFLTTKIWFQFQALILSWSSRNPILFGWISHFSFLLGPKLSLPSV